MKIALVGITGKIGSQIALEAKKRGHVVTGISRRAAPATGELAAFRIVTADILDQRALATAAKGHDSGERIWPITGCDRNSARAVHWQLPHGLQASSMYRGWRGRKAAGVPRPSAGRYTRLSGYVQTLRACVSRGVGRFAGGKGSGWTFFAPAAEIGPGEKKGKFRIGARNLIVDASGRSRISYGDYADAFVSEIVAGRHLNEIATAAY
jgi:putative NADH-flavin reductase